MRIVSEGATFPTKRGGGGGRRNDVNGYGYCFDSTAYSVQYSMTDGLSSRRSAFLSSTSGMARSRSLLAAGELPRSTGEAVAMLCYSI
jgi:hypothetical protein